MVYLICKGVPWQELGCLSWFWSNCGIFEWWQIGLTTAAAAWLWDPLRSGLRKRFEFCFVYLGFCFCFKHLLAKNLFHVFWTSWSRKYIYFWIISLDIPSSTVRQVVQRAQTCVYTWGNKYSEFSDFFSGSRKLVSGTKFLSSLPL